MRNSIRIKCLIAIVVCLASTSLAACKSGTSSNLKDTPSVQANPNKPELRALQLWQKEDYNSNPVAKYLESATGYKVKYEMLPQDKPQDKLNILIASGEPFDAITTTGTTDFKSLYADYARKGALLDLGPLLDTYGQNIKAGVDPEALEAAKIDGKLYAIPTKSLSSSGESLFIRQDWLDKVGLKAPRTLDELVAVLQAFKDKDPGGNGDINIPFTMKSEAVFAPNIVGAFGMPNFWNLVNSNLTPRILDPHYKDYVAFMSDLFNRGLLDKEFAANKDVTAKEKFTSGRAGMIVVHWADIPAMIDVLVKNVPTAKTAYIPAVVGKDGMLGLSESRGFDRLTFIPKASKHPEDMMKWMNSKLDPTIFRTMTIGEENKEYTVKDNAYTPILPQFNENRGQANNFLTGTDDKIYPVYWQARVRKDIRVFEAWKFINVTEPASTRIPDPLGFAPFLPEFSKKFLMLNTLVAEYTTKLVFGAEAIHDLEAFRQKFKDAGGEVSYQEVNAWYISVKK